MIAQDPVVAELVNAHTRTLLRVAELAAENAQIRAEVAELRSALEAAASSARDMAGPPARPVRQDDTI